MAETNLERYHRWFEEVWNQGNEDTIDELLSESSTGHGLGSEPVMGPAAFRQFWSAFLSTFDNFHVSVDRAIESGDHVAGCLTVTGRHVGDALGCPASGKDVSFTAQVFTRWSDGKIAEAWNLVDMAGLYQQAGAL
ncbi:MAG TPA: ester cyclase [Fimbriimonas sp.]|nr:ester cyclase [Fimbriimonas sp.]